MILLIKKIWSLILDKIRDRIKKKAFNRKLKELKKRDPFIYKH